MNKLSTPMKVAAPAAGNVNSLNGSDRRRKPSSDPSGRDVAMACQGTDLAGGMAKATAARLPEKYEMLCEFFSGLVSSIRLLRLKGYISNFSTEHRGTHTDRRFTYGHLAKMKTILPETLLIKKVLVPDEATCCMKPELQIVLQLDAIEDLELNKGQTGYSCLRKVFRERMEKFYQEHPKDQDIPEDQLPHPFTRRREGMLPTVLNASTSAKISSATLGQQTYEMPSCLGSTFQPKFSRKVPIGNSEQLVCFKPAYQDKISANTPFNATGTDSRPLMNTKEDIGDKSLDVSGPLRCFDKSQPLEATPAKFISTPARLMTSTPAIEEPKAVQPDMGCDASPLKSRKRTTRKLFLTPQKKGKSHNNEDEALSFLPEALLQSVRDREMQASSNQAAGVAEAKRRKRMLSCLPDLFNLIHLIFQSGSRTVMTKQELVHKIIYGHLKVTDRIEVEEQLKLLIELVPEWISQKKASSGDLLYSINKACSVEVIRERLGGAR